MGLIEIDRTHMPHAYVVFADGTTIAVPLVEGQQYTPVAKVLVTSAAGKTVDVCRVAVQHTTRQTVLGRSDKNPALARP